MSIEEKSIKACSGEDYRFCWDSMLPEEIIPHVSAVKLRDKLDSLVHGSRDVQDYGSIRKQYCALNRALNRKDDFPPRFRPTIKSQIRFGAKATPIQKLLTNDHQIIDLEWLSIHANFDDNITSALPGNFKMVIPSSHMAVKSYLTHEAAERFVGTGGSLQKKAEQYLKLSHELQLCVSTFQSEMIRYAWRDLVKRKDEIEVKVRKHSLKGTKNSWPDAWLAGELGEFGFDAAFWYQLITGERIAASSITYIRKKIKESGSE